jgi:flagellar hook-length control protein FliK
MADVIETDYTTNPPTVTERDFTPEEKAQRAVDEKAAADAVKAAEDLLAARVAAREALLARLGITDDEAQLLCEGH